MKPEEIVVRALLDLLKELVDQDERFLITNQSLHSLLSSYDGELVLAIRQGVGVELLEAWKQEVPAFRAEWLASPGVATTTFRGRSVVIVTESATADAPQKCADRKKKGGGNASGGQRAGSPRRKAR
jgi:hypothetical protein